MSRLYFIYSTMNSGKSLELLKSAYNYERQGRKTLLFTTAIDDRNGPIADNSTKGIIYTRLGDITKEAWLIERVDPYAMAEKIRPACIFVDEAQFLSPRKVYRLTEIVNDLNIPVMCYGLKNDFANNLFPGSAALLCYADKIQEIKTVCVYCEQKATMNMRTVGGIPSFDGEQVVIEAKNQTEISYLPVCRKHYMFFKQKAN